MLVKKFPLRKRTRSILTGSLAVAVTVVAAACSSGGSGGSSGGTTTLKIITWVNPPAVQAINKIDAEFEKANPNIKVKLQTAANVNGPYETLLQQSVNSGTADIVTSNFPLLPLPKQLTTSNTTPIQLYVTKGAFAPLNGQSFLSDYTTAAQQAETYQGKTYGLVSGAYQEGVFYNKQIFAKYHLAPPTTFAQFLALSQTLKSHGVQPIYTALGGVGPIYLQFIYYEAMTDLWYPKAPGGNLATALMNGTAKWTDPAFIQGMTEEKQIAQYLEPNYTGAPWQTMAGGDFAAGKYAMELDGSWDLSSLHSANPKLQLGYFPLPFSSNGRGQPGLRAERPHVLRAQLLAEQDRGDEVAVVLLLPVDLRAVREHHRHLLEPEQRHVHRLRVAGHGVLVRQGRPPGRAVPGAVAKQRLLRPGSQLGGPATIGHPGQDDGRAGRRHL